MAPVPKKKHPRSRSKRRQNAPGKQMSKPNLVKCSSCNKLRYPHRACPHCGAYKN